MFTYTISMLRERVEYIKYAGENGREKISEQTFSHDACIFACIFSSITARRVFES